MQTSLSFISKNQYQHLEYVITEIAKSHHLARIICFGARTQGQHSWSCFLADNNSMECIQYDLLVITTDGDKVKRKTISRAFQSYASPCMAFTVLIHRSGIVESALRDRDFFFTRVFREGHSIYSDNKHSITIPHEFIYNLPSSEVESTWKQAFAHAVKFNDGATYFISRNGNEFAVSMLQQVVRHLCIALIRIHLGYKPRTRRIKTLLALVEIFSDQFAFDAAYIYSDLKADCPVSDITIHQLQNKARQLMHDAERMYNLKVESISKEYIKTTRHLDSFESICLDTSAEIIFQKGSEGKITIESKTGNAEVEAMIDGTELFIQNPSDRVDITLNLTYVQLNRLTIRRTGKIICQEPIEATTLYIDQKSENCVRLKIEALFLNVVMNNTGGLVMEGNAIDVQIKSEGGGDFEGKHLQTNTAKINLNGSGNVLIHVEDELTTEINGSGDLTYVGTPVIKSLNLTGRDKIRSKGTETKRLNKWRHSGRKDC